jgi:hypothetical protein
MQTKLKSKVISMKFINGLFSTVEVTNFNKGIIRKIYKDTNILSNLWFKLNPEELMEHILQYNQDLIDAGLNLPKLHSIKRVSQGIELVQEFISGQTIREKLKYTDIKQCLLLYKKLMQAQRQAYEYNNTLMLDLNLDNFILNPSGDLYLIDITPPLYSNIITYQGDNLGVIQFLELCFNIRAKLAGTINDFLKPLVKNEAIVTCSNTLKEIDQYMRALIEVSVQAWSGTPLEQAIISYFEPLSTLEKYNSQSKSHSLKRLWLIKKLCHKRISIQEFYKLYSEASILRLLNINL